MGRQAMASVFDHLPATVRALVPELDDGWDGEPRADCARCPMVALDGVAPPPWSFDGEMRCCTAHPTLANFLLGRAIARGEPGRSRIIRRLAEPDGVSARGIEWPAAYAARYRTTVDDGFGRDRLLRCPYWVGASTPAACGWIGARCAAPGSAGTSAAAMAASPGIAPT